MDVRCSRCGTEYDFDDALVSERGTTVKCTNCGHQFKVFPGGGGGAPERWIVRKSSGRELVYTSLRDLQRAIAQRQVGPSDLLSRGGGHPLRALGAIAELEPFFQAQGPAVHSNEAAQRTLLGTGSQPAGQNAAPEPPTRVDTRIGAGGTPAGGFVPPRREVPLAPPRSPPPAGSDPFAAQELDPPTEPRNVSPLIPTEPPPQDSVPDSDGANLQNDGITASFRAYQDSFSDQSFPNVPMGSKRPALKWVVGVVIVGGLAFVAGTVGKKYARKFSSSPATSAQQAVDPRVGKLVEEGEALLQKGDLESAKEQLDKASALSDKDPAVLSLLARLEATRADSHWLSLRLIDPSHKAELDAERAELTNRLPRVQKAADAASAVAPSEPSGIRARVDALRLAGNVAKARELVGSLGADTSQPETAYVLAALDLAEASPTWATVIDRLRTAAAAERGTGRARAALVYALASSGAGDDATAELAKLDASGAQSGLVARLRAYVQSKAGTAPLSSGVAASGTSSPTVLAGSVQPRPAGAPGSEGASAEGPSKGDFRRLLEDAAAAKKSGDLGRADALYRAAREQQPGNVEALAGLGDVARLRGDSATATGYYDSVLHQNPTYLPALIASADLKWAAGDRVGALFLYKRVVNQTDPGTPYGQRAAARIAEAQSSGTGSPAEPAPEKKPAPEPAPKPSPPSETPSNIDTSDLPGFK